MKSVHLPITLQPRAWLNFGALARAAMMVCLLANTPSVQAQQSGWSITASPAVARIAGQSAVLLANGKVLVTGAGVTSTELYDPATGQWSVTGSMITARRRAVVVRLVNGKVLIVGGAGDTSAEIYDPGAGVWTATGSLNVARLSPAGVMLTDGRVLITGGAASPSAELFDPASGTWSSAGTMTALHFGGTANPEAKLHTATLLPDGRVLVVGGDNAGGVLRSAEIYDPVTGSWTATGDLTTPRFNHTATLLPNGKVLVAGGARAIATCPTLDGAGRLAELYDPATGQWSAASNMTTPRATHSATWLPNGKLLVTGVADSVSCFGRGSSEVYDPATGNWSSNSSLKTADIPLQAVSLANGKVLALGGNGSGAEIYDSGTPGVTSISAASFAPGVALATESIASGFGANLTSGTEASTQNPPPTQLAGINVKVRDRVGVVRLAPLFFASPGQINFQVPPGTAIGLATVAGTQGDSLTAASPVEIAVVAPGLFTSNSSGSGVPAAWVFRRKADGSEQYEPVTQTIDLGPATDQVFLLLYGTGIRFRSALSAVAVTIGGIRSEVTYAGAAPGFPGLDQVNVNLPRSLAGRGDVEVTLRVDGLEANPVRISIR